MLFSSAKRRVTARRVGVALAAALVLAFPPVAAAENVVIRLTSQTTSVTGNDVTPKGPSKGDRYVLASRLTNAVRQFDKPAGAVVGSDRGTVRFTSDTLVAIDGVARLPGGTIHFRGRGVFGLKRIPVVGGTGRYAGAKGTLIVDEEARNEHVQADGAARRLSDGVGLSRCRTSRPRTC